MTDESDKKPSKNINSQEIIEAMVSQMDVWTDQFGEMYATFNINLNKEHCAIPSKSAEAHIFGMLLKYGIKPSKRLIEDTILGIRHKSVTQKSTKETNLRVGYFEGNYYLNLMDGSFRAVRINANGWEIISNPPITFINPRSLKPLPEPKRGGSLDLLDELINVETIQDRNMIISWLLHSLFPSSIYPILVLTGEQGSAKSTTTKLLRSLIDPAIPLARPMQKDDRNLMVEACHNWILCFDNLSSLNISQADSLCRIATGGGFGVRSHYENKEETVFDAARPIILNGIENLIHRNDLLSRCIIIELSVISSEERKTEKELNEKFKALLPLILGALLDLFSKAITNLPNTKSNNLPRMADFAKNVLSVETDIGWEEGEFLNYYSNIIEKSEKKANESDDFFMGILRLMHGKETWSGSASELYECLLLSVPEGRKRYFPKPIKFPLVRIAPIIRKRGIEYCKARSSTKRIITFLNKNENFLIPNFDKQDDE